MQTANGPEGSARAAGASYLLVIACGVVTSALTLAGVYWLNKNATDFHIMGWYANYVIPIGAGLVGLAAGSGYGLASWLTGVRIGKGLLWTVVLLQTVAYIGAEYVEYRDRLEEFQMPGAGVVGMGNFPSFLEYYDLKARNFAWKEKHGDGAGEALGGWGYVFVLLGAAGFILCGLIAPAVLAAAPYCDSCQRYMSRQVLGMLPASVPAKKISKKDTAAQEAHDREQAEAAARGEAGVARLRGAAAAGDAAAFRAELAAAGSAKENGKLPRRVEVSLTRCKGCNAGRVALTLFSGSGDQVTQHQLDEMAVSSEFVRAVVAG